MQERLTNLLRNVISVGVDSTRERQHKYRVYMFNVFSIVAITVVSFFSIYNTSIGIYRLGVIEGIMAIFGLMNLLLFRKTKNLDVASNGIFILMLMTTVALLMYGGMENTGIFWLYTFPILALFMEGTVIGILWIAIFCTTALLIAYFGDLGMLDVSYSFVQVRQFVFSIIFVSVVAYFYELLVVRHEKTLGENNRQLQERVKEELMKSRSKDSLLMEQSRYVEMGQMLSMIAHQWRQPLSAITATTATLQVKLMMGSDDKEFAAQQLKNISEYAVHLSETINDFRLFFKEEKEMTSMNIRQLVDESISLVEISLNSNHIDVTVEHAYEEEFYTYFNELKQVMLNLLKNSEDVLVEKGVRTPWISIKSYRDGEDAVIEYGDNGGGIPKDIMGSIFDPYFTTKERNGTGLGLYMSKMIVEDHCGGSLTAQNSKEGALFVIRLPLEGEPDTDGTVV